MDNQRLRNLTTGYLHTDTSFVYEDIEQLTNISVLTHEIPVFIESLIPFLRRKIKDDRFFDGKFDPTHIGKTRVVCLGKQEKKKFLKLLSEKLGLKE